MNLADITGTIGVSILLLAFFLNLFDIITKESRSYPALNFIGAAIACYASVLIGFIPFVILEGTWAAVALLALVRPLIKNT